MWGFNMAWIVFTPVSQRTNPDEFPHLISTGWKISGWAAEWSGPGCTVCSECAQIWLISLFGLLRCGPASHSVGGRFENQGMGMTQQQGVQPKFLLAPLSWEPLGRQKRGGGIGGSDVKSPTCLGTWKAWLTIPFEATVCEGAGHWQVRTKMGLIVRETPRGGLHRTGGYAYTELIFIHSLARFNQRPSGESRY